MIYYAQIDENNTVVGVSQLSDKVNNPNLIELEKYDESLLGKLYKDGSFIDMEHYAELGDENIVKNIISLDPAKANVRNTKNLIAIQLQDYSLIGCKYINGEFVRIDPQIEALEKLTNVVENLTNKFMELENKLSNQ